MRILQLCKKFPFPLRDGESIAVTYLSKALKELGCDISILSMNTTKHYVNPEHFEDELLHYSQIELSPVDNRIKPLEAFNNLFKKESFHISRFECEDFSKKLEQLLRTDHYDVVLLETLYLAPYISIIRKHSNALIVMRAHNVEHEIWERITENTNNPLKKLYIGYLTKKLRRYEIAKLNDYNLLVPITERDLHTFRDFGYTGDAIVAPIGLDSRDFVSDETAFKKNPSLSYIGSLDWMPNIDGLKWFLNKVWPVLKKKYPTLEFHIAGRNTPEWLYQLEDPNITVYGEVPSSTEFLNRHPVQIVPLFSGSGMRAKILEGMLLGRVVVTTSLGLEGIDAQNKSEVLIANDVRQYIDAITYCISNQRTLVSLGRRAKEFVVQNYDNLMIARRLYKKLAETVPQHLSPKPQTIDTHNL